MVFQGFVRSAVPRPTRVGWREALASAKLGRMIEWSHHVAGGSETPALVGRDANHDYRAYAAPDVDDPNWTFLGRVKFDPVLGAMPATGSEIRSLTLREVLAESPAEHHVWIRGVTEAVFERQLAELRDRVGELDEVPRARQIGFPSRADRGDRRCS